MNMTAGTENLKISGIKFNISLAGVGNKNKGRFETQTNLFCFEV